MKKQILTAILVSFLVGIIIQMAAVIQYVGNKPRGGHKGDFVGMFLGIPFILNILLIFLSLPALLITTKRVGRKPVWRFLCWFLPRTIFIIYFLGEFGDWNFKTVFSEENLFFIPFANSLAWWFYWFKAKKFIKNENLPQ